MIVKMKRVSIVCRAKERLRSIETLRDLGVLHVVHTQAPKSNEVEKAKQRAQYIRRALDALPARGDEERFAESAEEVIERINKLVEEQRELRESLSVLRREHQRIEPFGSFRPQTLQALAAKGIYVKLYKDSIKNNPSIPEDSYVLRLAKDRDSQYFAVIDTKNIEVNSEELLLPSRSLAEIAEDIGDGEGRLEEIKTLLEECSGFYDAIEDLAEEAEETVSVHQTQAGMGAQGELSFVQGFVPLDAVGGFREVAAANGWAYRMSDPRENDTVPTLIRNPSWVELIRPVFNFIGIVPDYDEVDISACFLLFFSLFFALIVGDAGYGLIFFVLTFVFREKMKNASSSLFFLMLLMSCCTVIWGVITGNYFGIPTEHAPFPQLKVTWLQDQNNVMELCFVIGAIHLTIAHLWHFVRRCPGWISFAQLGWIGITWTMFFAARTMILGYEFPEQMYKVLFGCLAVVLFFMVPPKRIKQEWFNFVVFPLDVISSFVDLVSYIRLFAVGMATFAVASAFNSMSLGIGFDTLFSGVLASLVIFFGHALNITLAGMGVLVHGIRLNALEFSTHLGMEWTGVHYKPFSRRVRKIQQ